MMAARKLRHRPAPVTLRLYPFAFDGLLAAAAPAAPVPEATPAAVPVPAPAPVPAPPAPVEVGAVSEAPL